MPVEIYVQFSCPRHFVLACWATDYTNIFLIGNVAGWQKKCANSCWLEMRLQPLDLRFSAMLTVPSGNAK
ncbi:hypothetical protein LT85_0180 [Collimonas arenae]|uniref:Uncharacterized protein n=1 Tax=Collimonas arenae TaxID=279058 RepID=A0A0A1F6C6_9BURK|nr:hypothetical protein LT85_0180 [Collimonas arenae]